MNSSTADAFSHRDALVRRGRALELLTVGWNSVEAIVSVLAGVIAGSVALVGFGLDSVIETSSGVVMLWRLNHSNERDGGARERAERIALRLVGVSFLLLATYVAADAVLVFVRSRGAEPQYRGDRDCSSFACGDAVARSRQAHSCQRPEQRSDACRLPADGYLRISFGDRAGWVAAE